MAIYHLHVGIIGRGSGRSSVAAAAYRAGAKLKDEHYGVRHDYREQNSVNSAAYRAGEKLNEFDCTRKKGIVHSEILLPHNAPTEFGERETLWNTVEKSEKRKDAQTARDIDVALPVELSRDEQIDIMREYVQENFVTRGMIADFAVHDKNDGNPHAHILLTLRDVDEHGFKAKNRDWNKKEYLQNWRENWAELCNERLREKGLDERIDHRTLEAQGIDREPTIHIGATAKALERKGIITERVQMNRDIIARNETRELENTARNMHELKEGVIILDKEISALSAGKSNADHEARTARRQADKIAERADYIRDLNSRGEELKAERENMGVFASKREIDRQISQNERAEEQAKNVFAREYNITPDQAGMEIERLENRARSLDNFGAKLDAKIIPFIEERENFEIEYKRQNLLIDTRPGNAEIRHNLEQLEKESRAQISSTRDITTRNETGRRLNNVADQDFEKILQRTRPEHREALIRRREYERAQEYEREKVQQREREMTREISRGR